MIITTITIMVITLIDMNDFISNSNDDHSNKGYTCGNEKQNTYMERTITLLIMLITIMMIVIMVSQNYFTYNT